MKKLIGSIALLLGAAFSAGASVTDTVLVATTHLETPMKVTVITPDQALRGDSVPTVYILNGYGADYASWVTITEPNLGDFADKYGMLLVMPDGRDSWYWDAPANPEMQMETFFVEDLIPFIDSKYPTKRDPKQRAITGLSMGGHGSLWLATRHPDVWGNMGSMSGGVNIMPFAEKWKMKRALGEQADNKDVWEAHTVINLVPQMKENGQNIIFDCGSEDFFAGVNADLHQRLLDAKVPHDYTSRPGNHSHKYWRNSIKYHLLYFDTKFNPEPAKK